MLLTDQVEGGSSLYSGPSWSQAAPNSNGEKGAERAAEAADGK